MSLDMSAKRTREVKGLGKGGVPPRKRFKPNNSGQANQDRTPDDQEMDTSLGSNDSETTELDLNSNKSETIDIVTDTDDKENEAIDMILGSQEDEEEDDDIEMGEGGVIDYRSVHRKRHLLRSQIPRVAQRASQHNTLRTALHSDIAILTGDNNWHTTFLEMGLQQRNVFIKHTERSLAPASQAPAMAWEGL